MRDRGDPGHSISGETLLMNELRIFMCVYACFASTLSLQQIMSLQQINADWLHSISAC